MEGTIRRLHCRYRIIPGLGSPAPTTANLDRLVRDQGVLALAEAMEQALGNDETVYVLRNVHARVAVNTNGADPGGRWGGQMARAVIQNIAHDPADGENLMRFDNQAHYVAAFISDLLRGIAWRQWYYGTFAALKDLELPVSLNRVLLEYVDMLAAILKNLQDEGMLNLFLHRLDKDTHTWAWSRALGRSPGRDGEELLISAALQLVGSLDMAEARLPDTQTILQGFLSSNPPPVDWQDRAGLAAGVVNVFQFLQAQRFLRLPGEGAQADFTARLDRALTEFSWLEVETLRAGVLQLIAHARRPGLPVRPVPVGPGARQRRLLNDLLELIQSGEVRLDQHDKATPENGMRWYAALLSHSPEWANDQLAPRTIQQLLETWVEHLASSNGVLRSHDASANRTSAGFTGLGETGQAILSLLVGDGSGERDVETILTNFAGVFLLLRAILDIRLPGIVERSGFPHPEGLADLLLGLGKCWAGAPTESPDPGLARLAGLEIAGHDIQAFDGAAAPRFQAELLRRLFGQRLLDPAVMHVYSLEQIDGRTALVAGDGSGMFWPLGGTYASVVEAKDALPEWLAIWESGTGQKPETILLDDGLELTSNPSACSVAQIGNEAQISGYVTGRSALRTALQILGEEQDITTILLAAVLLRSWARWLRQFSSASLPYLLENFIRRPGRLEYRPGVLQVVLEPGPLDIVLELSGCLAAIDLAPWLGSRRVEFTIEKPS